MYTVFVRFDNVKALHLAHSDIKQLNFILKQRLLNLNEARNAAIKYINDFFDKIYGLGAWKHLPENIEPTPSDKADLRLWTNFKEGIFCTENPGDWKFCIWEKKLKRGFFYHSYEIHKLFEVEVLFVYEKVCSEEENLIFEFRKPKRSTSQPPSSTLNFNMDEPDTDLDSWADN